MEYLVEGHLGEVYISDCDPDIITETCEQCGDCDWIVGSWRKDDIEGKVSTIADYLINSTIQPPEEPISLIEELQYNTIEQIIEDYKEETNSLINYLKTDDLVEKEFIEPIVSIIKKVPSQIIENLELWGIHPYNEEKLIKFLVDNGLEIYYGNIFECSLSEIMEYVSFSENMLNSIYGGYIIKAIEEKVPGFSKEFEKDRTYSKAG